MDAKLREALDQIQANNLTMQSEIMGLTEFVAKQGSPEDAGAILEEIRALSRKQHESLLLLLENSDPELAARLDKRRKLPE